MVRMNHGHAVTSGKLSTGMKTLLGAQLLGDLKQEIASVISGGKEVRALYDWLGSHVQTIADLDSPVLTDSADRAWIILAEYDAGLRDDDSARRALAKVVEGTFLEDALPRVGERRAV